MLTHENPTGIEDHQTTCDWRSGRAEGVQAVPFFFLFFFLFVLAPPPEFVGKRDHKAADV